MIVPFVGSGFNITIIPNFVADTLAELDSNLATYVSNYVQVVDQGNKVYYVQDEHGVITRQEAYEFDNYAITNVSVVDQYPTYIQQSAPTPPVNVTKYQWWETDGAGELVTLWIETNGA